MKLVLPKGMFLGRVRKCCKFFRYIFTSRISPENRVKTKARKKFMQLPYKIDY